MVVLDTTIIIDHLRQVKKGESLLVQLSKKMRKEELAIALVTVQELYQGISTREREKEEMLLATITPLTILAYTYDIAKLAGTIVRDGAKPIQCADAAIAATTIVNGGQLVTLNKKDFQGIKDLELLSP